MITSPHALPTELNGQDVFGIAIYAIYMYTELSVKLLAYAVWAILIHHLRTLALQFYHIPSEQTYTLQYIYIYIYMSQRKPNVLTTLPERSCVRMWYMCLFLTAGRYRHTVHLLGLLFNDHFKHLFNITPYLSNNRCKVIYKCPRPLSAFYILLRNHRWLMLSLCWIYIQYYSYIHQHISSLAPQ